MRMVLHKNRASSFMPFVGPIPRAWCLHLHFAPDVISHLHEAFLVVVRLAPGTRVLVQVGLAAPLGRDQAGDSGDAQCAQNDEE